MDEALGVRVHVIPNGVVIPPARARRESGGKIIIGTLARIAPDKKLEELFASAECLENVEVRIAGPIENATYAAELRVLAAGSPIAFVGERDAGEFLSEIDLFAMISEPGGCPNALLEAMAAGLPIVATTHGGAHDMLGDAGILVARGDSVAMGAALAELAADPTRAAELGMAARARAQRCFDVETMATAYAKLCAPKTSELTEKSLRS